MIYLFDAAIAVILVLSIIVGIKKGAKKTLVSLIVHVVCIAVSFFLTLLLGENIYYDYVRDSVEISIEDSLENFSMTDELRDYYKKEAFGLELDEKKAEKILSDEKSMDERLAKEMNPANMEYTAEDGKEALFRLLDINLQDRITEKIPPCGKMYFDDIRDSKDEIFALVSMVNTDSMKASAYIEEHCVRNNMIRFVKISCFAICSLVLIVIAKLIVSLIFKSDSSVSAFGADAALGALAGLVSAAVICAFLAVIIKMIIFAGGTVSFIDNASLNQTIIFRYLYNLDKLLIK